MHINKALWLLVFYFTAFFLGIDPNNVLYSL